MLGFEARVAQHERLRKRWYDERTTGVVPVGTDFFRYRHDVQGPARKAGESLLILESTKMGSGGTRIWQYLPGQRRVKMSPDLAYDTPMPQSDGTQTMDDLRGFNGALDRFDFKLIGKREMLYEGSAAPFAFTEKVLVGEIVRVREGAGGARNCHRVPGAQGASDDSRRCASCGPVRASGEALLAAA